MSDSTVEQHQGQPRRYAYLDCEDAEKWAGHERLAEQLLHPGATWRHYRCYNRELPPLDSLADLDGVLISGSHYGCCEDLEWIRDLEAWLRQAVAQYPHVRFIGMCFGCQVLATALGGRVGKNPNGGFVLGVERMTLAEPLCSSSALQLAAADAATAEQGGASRGEGKAVVVGSGTISLIESHGDQVLELPPSCVLLATSATAPVEIFTNEVGNVLAVQGHAELSAEETLEKIHPAITAAGRLSAEEAAESQRSLQQDPTDAELVKCLFRRFMEVGLPEAAASSTADAATVAAAAEGAGPASAGQEASSSPVRTPDTAAAAAAATATAAASSPARTPGAATGAGTAKAAAVRLGQQLQRAVQAELDKGISEQLFLLQCNQAAADRYEEELVPAAAAARQQLEALREQRAGELGQHMQLLDGLEAQVEQLELTVTQLDALSKRLQNQLAGMD